MEHEGLRIFASFAGYIFVNQCHAVLRDKLMFTNMLLLSGQCAFFSTVYSLKNSPAEKRILAFASLNSCNKLGSIVDSWIPVCRWKSFFRDSKLAVDLWAAAAGSFKHFWVA